MHSSVGVTHSRLIKTHRPSAERPGQRWHCTSPSGDRLQCEQCESYSSRSFQTNKIWKAWFSFTPACPKRSLQTPSINRTVGGLEDHRALRERVRHRQRRGKKARHTKITPQSPTLPFASPAVKPWLSVMYATPTHMRAWKFRGKERRTSKNSDNCKS